MTEVTVVNTRTNAEWLADLRAETNARAMALTDLRAVIATGLPYALSGWLAPSDPQFDALAEDVTQLAMIQRIIAEELTEKQRIAIVAARINEMPIEQVAQQMGMERNALYKLLHDARLRLKKRMEREGLTPDEVLAAFGPVG